MNKYKNVNKPRSLPYPEKTMYGALSDTANEFPDAIAWYFMGKKTTYKKMIKLFDRAAKAFLANGIKRDDKVTICMPNCPQAVVCLYALNRIGAVANMVHPLSSEKEITYYLNYSDSKMILTLDLFYEKVARSVEAADNKVLVLVTRMQEELYPHLAVAFYFVKGKDFTKFPDRPGSMLWKDFLKTSSKIDSLPEEIYDKNHTSVMLYSGGTTGTSKGICLTDFNFNALGMQIREIAGCDFRPGLKFLSVMPIFHGFGLGIGIHTILENGAACILIPQFTNETYAKLVKKHRPNFIAGVPAIFESMINNPSMKNVDLSNLIGVFCGGDKLSSSLKHRADEFLHQHGANIQIREGYGLTECVTASCVTPYDRFKEGSIGVPLRDMIYRIVEPGTFNELPNGEEGEIIMTGPTLMLGYYKNEAKSEETLKYDENGVCWLFTGDIGTIDDDGYVFFVRRQKRMIITNGYNVYPTALEHELEAHPDVNMSCVIGVPDEKRGELVRAYIQLKDPSLATEEERQKLLEYGKKVFSGYARPREIVFKDELPKTLVGKVAFHILEEEARKEIADKNKTEDCIK